MERKTIGGFIAALRKANGMTQKDLAEKLNVSDKTISRWERDDGAPDLSAIPVIAEIFGVTCDELLRGERKAPAERGDPAMENEPTPKGEKQRQRLLAVSLSQYKTRTYITMGIAVLGLIAAAICNIGFLRSYLGFLFGAIFYGASLVCQAVFWNSASLSIAEESVSDPAVNRWKRSAISLTKKAVGLTVALFGFTTPLLLGDTYSGLVESWPLFGALGAGLFLLLYGVVCWFLNASMLRRGAYTLSEKEAVVYHHNHKLKRTCALVLVGVMLVTGITHIASTEIWGPWSIMEGTQFHDYESFVEFMEKEVLYSYNYSTNAIEEIAAPPTGSITYYDEAGNEVSEEEALRREIVVHNDAGEEIVVCTYLNKNETVCSVKCTDTGNGSALPITVYTYDDLREAEGKVTVRNILFTAAYCVEAAAVLAVYFRKRMR